MSEISFPEKLFARISRKREGPLFAASLAILLTVASLTLALPDWSRYDPASEAWRTLALKSADLTNPLTHLDPGSWLAKKVFRLSVPLVMKVTGASPPVVLALQYGCGILLFFFGYKLALQVMRDRVTAVFTASALAFTYFGRAAFFDVGFLWFDGIAYFLLLMAMYAPRGWQVFLFALAAAWTDERAFMALSVVMLFHMMHQGTLGRRELLGAFRNPRWLATAAAAGLYLATRFWMQSAYGMKTPAAGAHWRVITQTWPHLPLGSWTFFEGFWLAAAVFLVVAWSRRDFLLPLLVGVLLSIFTLVAACVFDITRSGSFAMPIVFVMGGYLAGRLAETDLRWLYLSVLLVSILFPPIFVCSDWGPIDSLSPSLFVRLLTSAL